ncbi:hypothetical protein ACGFX4_12055 [Kitasatospora sp. NPDC048365]|uniref:hypothetical protein n=1 Tax=Kitasatospora sp. NPDC048365 TaxID=3364050 RepID=UPI003724C276
MTAPVAGKYARVERERRFLLAGAPDPAGATAVRRITDRYLTGTRMRLRAVEQEGVGERVWKLTQKVPAERPGGGAVQGLITNTYLSEDEYRVFAALEARELRKTRLSLPPLGVDVFDGPLAGLVLAEAEFEDDAAAAAFAVPAGTVAEVTDDPRFTGGALVRTGRAELIALLGEFGIGAAG